MSKKDINLLPEDLRKNIGKIPKMKPRKDLNLDKPTKDVFGFLRKSKDNSSKEEKILEEQKKSISDKPKESAESISTSIKPTLKDKIEEEKISLIKATEDEEEKKPKKVAKGIFTISKGRPEISFLLKSFFAKFNKPGKKSFAFGKIFSAIGKNIKKTPFHRLNINLVLKEEEFFETKGKEILKTLYLEITICLSIILIFYFSLAFSQWRMGDKGEKMKAEIFLVENQISNIKKENKEMIDVQKKLLYIKDLLSRHVYWTNFFALLEKYTIPEVYFEGFNSAVGEKLNLKGTAKNSQAVVRQIIALKNAFDFLQNAEINDISITKNDEEVSFTISLTLIPDIFLSK